MKKSIIAIISIILIFAFSFSTFAHNTYKFEYNYNNITITFDAVTPFDEAERIYIANILANGSSETEPAGILCIFGHDWIEDTIITVTHCASNTQPRCLEEVFDIAMCSRCEKTKTERIGYAYVHCCP